MMHLRPEQIFCWYISIESSIKTEQIFLATEWNQVARIAIISSRKHVLNAFADIGKGQ